MTLSFTTRILFSLLISIFAILNLDAQSDSGVSIMILGIAQDAGYPQIQCQKSCCEKAWNDHSLRRMTASLALLDHKRREFFLIDATPDIKDQLRKVTEKFPYELEGILLTHAHMGHYTGLMHLGREAINAPAIPVYAMPRMKEFLNTNGPWDQLVTLGNIRLFAIENMTAIQLTENLKVTPFLVPHRDEYSETVGFYIEGTNRTAWYVPDIDKWHKSNIQLKEIVEADIALLDGTFYANGEIPGRNMDEVPHPFIEETMDEMSSFGIDEKGKVFFTHFNHTNPALWDDSTRNRIREKGFNLAREGQLLRL